jgi:lysophospholipase L1-like esterase
MPQPYIQRRRLPLYAGLIVAAVLAVLELAARLIEPTALRTLREFRLDEALAEYKLWQQTLFMSFGGAHQPDPLLLWRFRPGLDQSLFQTNSRGLLAADEIDEQKPPNTVRVLLLGDSSPVGLGLRTRAEAFGEVAAGLLQHNWRGLKKIELINAAVSGYSSEQAKRFLLTEGLRYQPDMVVCYLGNNDGAINGYLSDREIFAAQDWSRGMRTRLQRLALYRLLRAALSPMLAALRSPATGTPAVRLSAEEFGDNVKRIIDSSRQAGAGAVFINPPVPLRWPAGLQFKLFSRLADSAGRWVMADQLQRNLARPVAYCLDSTFLQRPGGRVDEYVREVFAAAYADSGLLDSIEADYRGRLAAAPDDPLFLNNLGVAYWRQHRFDRAVEVLERCVARDTMFAPGYYNLGIVLNDMGENERAQAVLQEAVDRDVYSLRIKTPYRRALFDAVASSGGVLLDGVGLFQTYGNGHLFIDHCHPTAEGHALLGSRLAEIIDSLLQETQSEP